MKATVKHKDGKVLYHHEFVDAVPVIDKGRLILRGKTVNGNLNLEVVLGEGATDQLVQRIAEKLIHPLEVVVNGEQVIQNGDTVVVKMPVRHMK